MQIQRLYCNIQLQPRFQTNSTYFPFQSPADTNARYEYLLFSHIGIKYFVFVLSWKFAYFDFNQKMYSTEQCGNILIRYHFMQGTVRQQWREQTGDGGGGQAGNICSIGDFVHSTLDELDHYYGYTPTPATRPTPSPWFSSSIGIVGTLYKIQVTDPHLISN